MPLLPGTLRKSISSTKYAAPDPGVGLLLRGLTSGRSSFLPPAAGPTIDYTLPSAAPASNGYVLSSTTAGVLSWAAIESGITIDTTPITGGGANRILLESATGKVSSNSAFVFDGTKMGIGTATPYSSLSNSASNVLDNIAGHGVQTTGFIWAASGQGYVACIRNPDTGAIRNGLLISVISLDSGSRALTVDSGGVTRFVVQSDGLVGVNKSSSIGAQLHTVAGSATTIGSIIQGAAAQTANLLEVNSSGGNGGDLLKIASNGVPTFAGSVVNFAAYTDLVSIGGFGVTTDGNRRIGLGYGGKGIQMAGGWPIGFTSGSTVDGTGSDAFFLRDGVASIQMGADAAVPVAQTFKAHDGLGTDIAGAALNIAGGKGTGTGLGGSVKIQTAPGDAGTETTLNDLSATVIEAGANATAGTLGFYGATPVALQTGVAVSAAGIHAALVNLGLITA